MEVSPVHRLFLQVDTFCSHDESKQTYHAYQRLTTALELVLMSGHSTTISIKSLPFFLCSLFFSLVDHVTQGLFKTCVIS